MSPAPPSERPEQGPRRLRESLDRLLGTMKAPPVDVLTVVFGSWSDVVGEDLAAHSRPTALDGDRLVVTCDSSAWASEFRWLEQQVLTNLTRVAGSSRISSVHVRVDKRR
jgi:predicted nucleic acid-binding Zn ribbon protein